jgi:hypothetical protein
MSQEDDELTSEIEAHECTEEQNAENELQVLVPKGFMVRDAGTASWVVRRIIEAREHAIRAKEWAASEHRRAHHEEYFFQMAFGRQLEEWARAQIDQLRGRRRSVSLPTGTVGFRQVGGSLIVQDDKAVVQWARIHCPSAVVVHEKLSVKIIKDHFEATGEIPEGATLVALHDNFYIR